MAIELGPILADRKAFMKVHEEQRGSAKVIFLNGSMTGGDDRDWVEPVTKLLDEGKGGVILEMSQVSYISSAGLGDLVRITALANSQGVKFMLAAVSPFVEAVLKTTHLDKFFDVSRDLDSALAKID